MKFSNFRELKSTDLGSDPIKTISNYLVNDLGTTIRELRLGLRKLAFAENFNGWIEESLTIAASSEAKIVNRLRPIIPTQRVILRSTSSQVSDGATLWSQDYVYLKNESGSAVTLTVAFLK